MCDFSMIADMPEMYQHCKETEDKNLTAFDFITDHLIDFDIFFDVHENNSSEKPHQPQTHHITNFFVQLFSPQQIFTTKKQHFYNSFSQKTYSNYTVNYTFNFSSSIFHPPIV